MEALSIPDRDAEAEALIKRLKEKNALLLQLLQAALAGLMAQPATDEDRNHTILKMLVLTSYDGALHQLFHPGYATLRKRANAEPADELRAAQDKIEALELELLDVRLELDASNQMVARYNAESL